MVLQAQQTVLNLLCVFAAAPGDTRAAAVCYTVKVSEEVLLSEQGWADFLVPCVAVMCFMHLSAKSSLGRY